MKPFEKAKWIWEEGYGGVNTYVTFYDLLEMTGNTDGCVMNLSVDTNYCLEINGTVVSMGQYADYPFDKVYDAIPLDGYLTPGENRIVIRCWHQGNDSSTVRGEDAGLIYEIQRGGEVLAYSSTETFSAPESEYDMGPVEYVSGQLGFSFRYHAGRVASEEPPTVEVEKPMPARLRPIKKLVVGDDDLKARGGPVGGQVLSGSFPNCDRVHLGAAKGFNLALLQQRGQATGFNRRADGDRTHASQQPQAQNSCQSHTDHAYKSTIHTVSLLPAPHKAQRDYIPI